MLSLFRWHKMVTWLSQWFLGQFSVSSSKSSYRDRPISCQFKKIIIIIMFKFFDQIITLLFMERECFSGTQPQLQRCKISRGLVLPDILWVRSYAFLKKKIFCSGLKKVENVWDLYKDDIFRTYLDCWHPIC